jgi:hypothetical protein
VRHTGGKQTRGEKRNRANFVVLCIRPQRLQSADIYVTHIDKPRTGGVELHELGVLQGDARAQGHGVSVARAGVRRGAAEVGATVAAGGQHRVVRSVGM